MTKKESEVKLDVIDTEKPKESKKSAKPTKSPSTKKATTPRQKTLNMKMIDKQYDQLNKLSTYVLDPKENVVVKYYEKFDEGKIQELLKLAYEHLNYVEDEGLSYFNNDDEFIHYLQYLMIYKFSTVVELENEADFEEHINIMNKLNSLGLYKVFLEDIFDGNEVLKVLDRLQEFHNLVENIGKIAMEAQEDIQNVINNKEIFEDAFKGQAIHPLNNPSGTVH